MLVVSKLHGSVRDPWPVGFAELPQEGFTSGGERRAKQLPTVVNIGGGDLSMHGEEMLHGLLKGCLAFSVRRGPG